MFSASDETCLIEELRASFSKIGALHPVIITQFGVAAGNNRLKAVPEWPADKRNVKNRYEHICIEVSDNIHEDKGREWFKQRVVMAADELIKLGVKPSEVVRRIAEDFPMHPRTIYRYLPDEFKGGQGPKGPRPPKIDTCQFPDAGVGDKLGVDASRDKLASPGSGEVLGSTLSSLVTERGVEDRVGEGVASSAHGEVAAAEMTMRHLPPQSPVTDMVHVSYKARCEELEIRVKDLEVELDTWKFKAETSGKLAEEYYQEFKASDLGKELEVMRVDKRDRDQLIESMAMRITSLDAELSKAKTSPPLTPSSQPSLSAGTVKLGSDMFTCSKCRTPYRLEVVNGNLFFNRVGEPKV